MIQNNETKIEISYLIYFEHISLLNIQEIKHKVRVELCDANNA